MSSGTFLRITQFKERVRSASYSVGEIGGFDLNTLHSVCSIVFWAHSTFMKLTSLSAVSSGSWTMHLADTLFDFCTVVVFTFKRAMQSWLRLIHTGVLRSLNARALTQISLMISLVPWLTFRLGNLTLWIWWPMVCLLWNFEFFVCFLFPPASACAIQPTEHTTIVQCAFSTPVILEIINIGS